MKRPGNYWKVDINGQVFAAQRVTLTASVGEAIVTNTEGIAGDPDWPAQPGSVARIRDAKDGTITIVQATFDDERSPFAAPFDLELGKYYSVRCSPADRTGQSYPWDHCMLKSFTHEAIIPGGQPVTLVFVPDGIRRLELE